MRRLRRGLWTLRRSIRGVGQSLLVWVLAVASMATCLLILGTLALCWTNAQRAVLAIGVDAPISAYLLDSAQPEDISALRGALIALPDVQAVEVVSGPQQLQRLRDGLGPEMSELAELDPHLLPTSLEIYVTSAAEPPRIEELVRELRQSELIDEVQVLGPWLRDARRALETLTRLALAAGALVCLGCVAIVAFTIRLAVSARRRELEILQLVGGTPRFVRAPFVIEGTAQGALAAALALGLLWLAYLAIHDELSQGLSFVFATSSVRFFSPVEIGCGLGFGAVLGMVGARLATALERGR